MTRVQEALSFAVNAHSGQMDKSGTHPYVEHVIRVGRLARAYAEAHPDEFTPEQAELLEAAGYLHDVVEDCPGYTLASIRDNFGEEVADLVMSVTRIDPKYADRLGFTPERKETYREFVERSYKHPLGKYLKMADLADNMSPERHNQLPESEKGIMKRYLKAKVYLETGVWPKGSL